jgi:hypothetical protein
METLDGTGGRTKIMTATPVGRGECTTAYAGAMFNLARHFQATRPDVHLSSPLFAQGVVDDARNMVASRLLEDPSSTHLLFVDSDVGFPPRAVARMLDFDKDMVGAFYPKRFPGPPAFVGADAILRDKAGGFSISGGFVRVAYLGMGLTLIRRAVFERLAEAHPDLLVEAGPRYAGVGITRLFQCFAPVRREDGYFLSEDISFCRRWTDLGGELWGLVDEALTHVGTVPFKGRYSDHVNAGAADTPPAPAHRYRPGE